VRSSFRPPSLPDGVRDVLATLRSAGHDAYVVGGAPRDWLVGRSVNDFDVATSARPEIVTALFRRVIPVGLHHGTVTVLAADLPVEVTTFRRSCPGLGPAGRAEEAYADSLDDDLAARDFTCNAMAWTPSDDGDDGWLVDPFGGRDDLQARVLRAVPPADARFREDPLRVLRGCRFAAVFDWRPDADTAAAMVRHGAATATCAAERLGSELTKLLVAPAPQVGIELMAACGLLARLVPEAGTGTLCPSVPPEPVLRWAALLAPADRAAAEARLQVFRLGRSVVTTVGRLVAALATAEPLPASPVAVRRFMARVGPELVTPLLSLLTARNTAGVARLRDGVAAVRSAGYPLTVADLALSGDDVRDALGGTASPDVGRMLRALLDAVLEDPTANERTRLLGLLRAMTADGSRC